MPWNETCAMRERLKFVALAEAGEETMAELCRHFGISRKIGYKFLQRFAAKGVDGLSDRSHAPHEHPHAISEEIDSASSSCGTSIRARSVRSCGGINWSSRGKRARGFPADTSPFAACTEVNDT